MRRSILLILLLAAACGPSDGHNVETYGSGEKQAEGMIQNGEKSGKWVFYWKNGNVQTEGYYTKGEPEGRWTYYDENGRLIAQGTYRDGQMWNGTFVRYIMGTKKFITVENGKQSGG